LGDPQGNVAGIPNTSFVPTIVGIVSTIVLFALGLLATGKLESKKLLKTTGETVAKECYDCLSPQGTFVTGMKYGTAEKILANRWFTPIGEPHLSNLL
jgi:hypothetical protein